MYLDGKGSFNGVSVERVFEVAEQVMRGFYDDKADAKVRYGGLLQRLTDDEIEAVFSLMKADYGQQLADAALECSEMSLAQTMTINLDSSENQVGMYHWCLADLKAEYESRPNRPCSCGNCPVVPQKS